MKNFILQIVRATVTALALILFGLTQSVAQTLFVSGGLGEIYQVSSGGVVSPFVGITNTVGLAFDSGGLLTAGVNNGAIQKSTATGNVTVFVPRGAGLDNVRGIAFDTSGNLYVANDNEFGGMGGISKVSPSGTVSSFGSPLSTLYGLTIDGSGNLYTANVSSGVIYKLNPAGVVTTFATVTGGPIDLAVASNGDVFTANYGNGTISRISPAGNVSSFVSVGLGSPYGITFDIFGNLLVGDFGTGSINKITPEGMVSVFATGLPAGIKSMVFAPSAIPEPSTYAAISGGVALVGAMVWRRRRSAPRAFAGKKWADE